MPRTVDVQVGCFERIELGPGVINVYAWVTDSQPGEFDLVAVCPTRT
jgi:hypothetical protein